MAWCGANAAFGDRADRRARGDGELINTGAAIRFFRSDPVAHGRWISAAVLSNPAPSICISLAEGRYADIDLKQEPAD